MPEQGQRRAQQEGEGRPGSLYYGQVQLLGAGLLPRHPLGPEPQSCLMQAAENSASQRQPVSANNSGSWQVQRFSKNKSWPAVT